MKKFLDEDFLLENDTSKFLFNNANSQPIFDYHCHLNPEEIEQNKRFDNITDLWLGGDHYKWRPMRAMGFNEELITGNADPYDKFYAWAHTIENLLGNPLYHWTHLELQRYFEIKTILNRKTAKEIYEEANQCLKNNSSLSVHGILNKFNVYAVGTTDDPTDSLIHHKNIKKANLKTKVVPSFRPDKVLHIYKSNYKEYIDKLSTVSKKEIKNLSDLVNILENRLDFFIENGCLASDHGIQVPPSVFPTEKEANNIFEKKMNEEQLSLKEIESYQGYILLELAKMYNKKNIVMQIHMNVMRDNNPLMYDKIGPDTGFDSCHDNNIAYNLSAFMRQLAKTDEVPKMVWYSLNPKDYYVLASLMGAYQGKTTGRMQLGTSWWYCDHIDGMEQQMKILGNIGCLPLFIGMLTDSRSFLSYPRHEYFRRIMCNIFGTWAEKGMIPNDKNRLKEVVENISFKNAEKYFEY